MLIKITAKENNTEFYCKFEFDLHSGTIEGSNNINFTDTVDNQINLIYSHDPESLIHSIPPQNRNYLMRLKIPYDTSIISNIYRSLAVISRFFHLDLLISAYRNHNSNNRKFALDLYNHQREILYDFMCFEKTGTEGNQPTLYLIKEKKVVEDINDLTYLYEKGLLFKIETELKENLNSFFIPFDIRRIRNIELGIKYFYWEGLLLDRKNSIKQFTEK